MTKPIDAINEEWRAARKEVSGQLYELSKNVKTEENPCDTCEANNDNDCLSLGDDCLISEIVWRKVGKKASLPATANFPFDSEGMML